MTAPQAARRLGTALLACHAALAAAVAAAAVTLPGAGPARLLALLAGLVPLAAMTPGLLRGRRNAYVYGALILVLYVGFAATEVVASASRSSPAALVMLLALAELALLLTLARIRP